MEMIGFLILFPLIVAVLLMIIRHNTARNVIVIVGTIAIAVVSIALVVVNIGTSGQYYYFQSDIVNYVCMAVSVIIGITIVAYGVKYRNVWAIILALIQLGGSLVFEFVFAHDLTCTRGLYLDSLSLIMTLIIGVIGSGNLCICNWVYA